MITVAWVWNDKKGRWMKNCVWMSMENALRFHDPFQVEWNILTFWTGDTIKVYT